MSKPASLRDIITYRIIFWTVLVALSIPLWFYHWTAALYFIFVCLFHTIYYEAQAFKEGQRTPRKFDDETLASKSLRGTLKEEDFQ